MIYSGSLDQLSCITNYILFSLPYCVMISILATLRWLYSNHMMSAVRLFIFLSLMHCRALTCLASCFSVTVKAFGCVSSSRNVTREQRSIELACFGLDFGAVTPELFFLWIVWTESCTWFLNLNNKQLYRFEKFDWLN